MRTDTDTDDRTPPFLPEGWKLATHPTKEGAELRFRGSLRKYTARGHAEDIARVYFDTERDALAWFWSVARPARVRSRVVATVSQEWLEPAYVGSGGVRFAVHRLYTDAHARREVP